MRQPNIIIMNTPWQPSSSIQTLRQRAHILQKIRQFFAERNILEVETPILCSTSVTDPFIASIPAELVEGSKKKACWLQTSPEYAMKRLLAAGSGPIYQMTKSFRQGEIGKSHNPEFTMLEWYRPCFDDHALMQEVDELLQQILHCSAADKITYQALFEKYLNINPHQINIEALKNIAAKHNIHMASEINDKDSWLMILMSHYIEPKLGHEKPVFVYDFPASQAALSRIKSGEPEVAARFEVYAKGMELANGFHELTDEKEQSKRFEENLTLRKKLNLPAMPIDEYFLQALKHGLPDCAGVALGVDRLIMLALNISDIKNAISFDILRV